MKIGRKQPEPAAAGPGSGEPAAAAADEVARQCTVHDGLRIMVQLLPRVMRGMRRPADEPIVRDGIALGPRHGSVLALVRERPSTVGSLAAALELNLASVSGLVGDLDRVGFVDRSADPTDRRRTIVRIVPSRRAAVDAWLEGATAPITRALERLSPEERATFVKAMGILESEYNTSCR